MKSQHLCLLSAVVASFVAGGAFADEIQTRTWTDATGNHKWSEAGNWDPQISGDHNNIFPAGCDWEVIIDATPKYYSLQLPEGSGKVTFNGGGQLKADSSAYIQVGAGREVNVDGIVFRLCLNSCSDNAFINGTLRLSSKSITLGGGSGTYQVIGGDAKVIVEGGNFGENTSYLCLSNNATLTVRGGQVHANRYLLCSPDAPRESITRVRLLGGTFWNDSNYAYTMSVRDGAHLEFLGGRLLWGRGDDLRYNVLDSAIGQYSPGNYFADCLPQFGAELVIPTSTTYSPNGAMKFHYSNREYDFGGTVYVTNNTGVAAGNVYFNGEGGGTLSIRGGATIYANAFRVNSNRTFTNNLDLTRLNLGIGGICRYQNAGSPYQYLNFLDGIEFGAWGGDVARSGAYTERLLVRPQGPVVFDTKDCFDPATSRTINMDCIRLNDVTDFKATGGGTVALYPGGKWSGEFRTLEVADNTTLAFCTNVLSGVKAMNLKLGANAKVKINMANGDYVDASSTAEFGDGAKIVVTGLPETLAEGMFYPVYSAPAGTDPDLSKIEYAEGDWPAGWHLAKRGCSIYLTDGKEPVHAEELKTGVYSWSGGGSDNIYTNADNWVSNRYVKTGGADIYFKGRKNTDIYIDTSMGQRSWPVFGDAGPFLFSGARITFQLPSSSSAGAWGCQPSIRNESKFPVVVSNKLSAESLAVWVAARKQGSVSLMSSSSLTSNSNSLVIRPLFVAGDIRIGGACTSEYVRVANDDTNYSTSDRATRLTIMPGGSLKTLNQSGDFNERGAGAFAVATGGAIDIAGTELLLTSNNTHYVDGTMTVACPLVPQGRQVFRGDGTLALAGGVSGEGIVRVEGGLTLVPGAWGSDVTLSVKEAVTIAPAADWDLGDADLDLAHHSTLTFATGGHKVTLRRAVSSVSSAMTVAGGGQLVLAETGTKLNRLSLVDGSTVAVGKGLVANGAWTTVLAVRDDSVPIELSAEKGNIKQRKYVDETGFTVYCAKGDKGLMVIFK